MQTKRNKALLFLGLLVVTLMFLFGHVFPVLEALKTKQDDPFDSLIQSPEKIIVHCYS
jgi:hypothetical protein